VIINPKNAVERFVVGHLNTALQAKVVIATWMAYMDNSLDEKYAEKLINLLDIPGSDPMRHAITNLPLGLPLESVGNALQVLRVLAAEENMHAFITLLLQVKTKKELYIDERIFIRLVAAALDISLEKLDQMVMKNWGTELPRVDQIYDMILPWVDNTTA